MDSDICGVVVRFVRFASVNDQYITLTLLWTLDIGGGGGSPVSGDDSAALFVRRCIVINVILNVTWKWSTSHSCPLNHVDDSPGYVGLHSILTVQPLPT